MHAHRKHFRKLYTKSLAINFSDGVTTEEFHF